MKSGSVLLLVGVLSGCVSTGQVPNGGGGISVDATAIALTSALATAIILNSANVTSHSSVEQSNNQADSHDPFFDRDDDFFKHKKSIGTGGGRCLDISRQVVDGAPLQVWDCNDRVNQKFEVKGQEIRIGGKCLDISQGDKEDGARVIAYRCNGTENQKWSVFTGRIRSQMNNKCLDVVGGNYSKGTPVVMWSCHGRANQQFRLF